MTARRPWWKTALGILFAGLMLFPVYWMVNVSFTKTSDLRLDPPHLFPVAPTLEGYQQVLAQQLPNLVTSLILGLGCVVLTIVIAAPRRTRSRSSTSAPAALSTSPSWSRR